MKLNTLTAIEHTITFLICRVRRSRWIPLSWWWETQCHILLRAIKNNKGRINWQYLWPKRSAAIEVKQQNVTSPTPTQSELTFFAATTTWRHAMECKDIHTLWQSLSLYQARTTRLETPKTVVYSCGKDWYDIKSKYHIQQIHTLLHICGLYAERDWEGKGMPCQRGKLSRTQMEYLLDFSLHDFIAPVKIESQEEIFPAHVSPNMVNGIEEAAAGWGKVMQSKRNKNGRNVSLMAVRSQMNSWTSSLYMMWMVLALSVRPFFWPPLGDGETIPSTNT